MNCRCDFILPECYVDTNLVETLGCIVGCNHQKGCNQVAKVMQSKFSERFAVGIIDADRRRPSYMEEFYPVVSGTHVSVLRHNSRPHFIIQLSPAADGFILATAAIAGVDLEKYGFSSLLKEFTVQTKSVMSNKDPRFKSLFKAMENNGEVRLLKQLLKYFMESTYSASNERIAEIFSENIR